LPAFGGVVISNAANGSGECESAGLWCSEAFTECRLDHRLAAVLGPNLSQIPVEACQECLASTNGATVQVARLTWLQLRRFADFSYV
jgi:hypothetical protein